ncbi:fructose-bisphosphate aldolase [Ruminiclostridium hungatei]|uniref:Fructose-bisphosphate aldolase n=1 Tax=Ruminiclostridium hungatei TaxID=48256 RepID=A0A1V4SKK3_RUMHU|nr:class II fructose-bisphosphate aldolase [Ruminiclostridium hungatei]OPX44313.1 fructose-bisphosphate aldolase [Ruminiclostridium hungatei]
MRFVPMKEILELGRKKGIAYGAFEFWSVETARAAILAGSKLGMPVILQCGQTEIDMMGGFEDVVSTVEIASRNASVPVALHLDHAVTYEACNAAIQAGFSSVMIDLSAKPLEENIYGTLQVVERAHPANVTVEAELGRLVGEEGAIAVKGHEAAQTDPEEARRFVEATGIDCLAVSIGTQHGQYKFEPKLNIERLKKIYELTKIPLVLHGGSGTPMWQVQESIRNGINKVNICTDIVLAMGHQYVDTQKGDLKYTTANLFNPANEAAQKIIEEKMRAFALLDLYKQ